MLSQTISRIRRNHGLEHATIHVLSENHSNFSAQGNSTHQGFYLNIYGDVSAESVEAAVREAHQRMKAGEHHLAVHPNCGTALLTTATLATLAAQAMFGLEMWRQRSERTDLRVLTNGLPSAILAASLATVASKPLGLRLQEQYTVSGDLGDLQIAEFRATGRSPVARFFQLLLTGLSERQANSYFVRTVG